MPDRLIRFETLRDRDRPRLLSRYDAEKNIIHIDREEAECLPRGAQDQLLFTTIEYTRLTPDGRGFQPYEMDRHSFLYQ